MSRTGGYSRTRDQLKTKHKGTVLSVSKHFPTFVLVCILVCLTGIEDSQDLRDSHCSTDAKPLKNHRHCVDLKFPV